ncbi:MAG: type II secretion system F family protein [Proteobacteria bacterium]|nr:type II secretion system F family protein [Pseudomonadota bacterium]
MPIFRYEAINSAGRIVSGTHAAEIMQEVETWLQKGGLSPVNIQILSEQQSARAKEASLAVAAPTLSERLFGITLEDKILFCRQLATLLAAGVNIIESFGILALQVSNPMLRAIILAMTAEVESGASLSDAVSRQPKAFNVLFFNIVKVGEETGSLDKAFAYLAALYENEKAIKERIKSATRYPKFVIFAITGAVFFLMSFVVPKFAKLFAAAKVELPLATKILMGVSTFFADNTLGIVGAALALFIAYRLALGSREFVLFRDRLLLRVPIFGPLSTKIYMARFCRVFSILTTSGIDIIKTLRLSTNALENLVLFQMVEEITGEVEDGVSLHEAMAKHHTIPPMVPQMIAVGEQSGRLDEMMAKVADYYDLESDYTIRNLSTLIEPVLLLVLGAMVGLIALAIFTPMWDMLQVVRGGN